MSQSLQEPEDCFMSSVGLGNSFTVNGFLLTCCIHCVMRRFSDSLYHVGIKVFMNKIINNNNSPGKVVAPAQCEVY